MRILTLSFFFSIVFPTYIYAQSRVVGDKSRDPALRCASKGVDQSTCEERRKYALEKKCITEEEYNDLKRLGSYPLCDPFEGEGLRQFGGHCPCGCFAPETLIQIALEGALLQEKKTAEEIVFGKDEDLLVTHLKESSHLNEFEYGAEKIRLKTFGKELKKIYKIKAEGKDPLLLTEKHPILLSSGVMIQAKDLKETDSLLSVTGDVVSVEKIERMPFKQDVVNFSLDTKNPKEHLIFANDLVVGDQYWQASLEDLLNQVLIRER